MVGDADVADLALCLGLQSRLVQACAVTGLGAEGGVVELVDVDVVGLQHLQTVVQMLPEGLRIFGAGLGSDVDVVPHVVEGQADLLLTVGVHIGGVEEGKARLIGPAQEPSGVFLADTLDGQGAEGILGGDDPGTAQGNGFHRSSRLSSSGLSYFITRQADLTSPVMRRGPAGPA